MIVVQFTPPYTNKHKEVECCHIDEARMLADWLESATSAKDVQILSASMVYTEIGT
jgi:hypothetical protein